MLMIVDPWGDDRDDLRSALNTIATIPANTEDVYSGLTNYLNLNEKKVAGPAQMRQLMEGTS